MKLFTLALFVLVSSSLVHTSSESSVVVSKTKTVKTKQDTVHLKRATRYNATVAQCDSSPFTTADGSKIIPKKVRNGTQRWVALSRDLIWNDYRNKYHHRKGHWRGKFKFGDTIKIRSKKHPYINGSWVIHDCMASRYSNSIDFLVAKGIEPKLGIATDVKIIY